MTPISIPVTGTTSVLGVLGHPLDHSRSVALINEALRQQARDAVYVPLDTHPARLAAGVAGLRVMHNFRGAVVTMPHKAAIVPLLDVLTPEAQQVGAANVIRRAVDGTMYGTMLDGEGFVAGLPNGEADVQGKRAYLAGAGGAASGIAFALGKYGALGLTIYNRTAAKAEQLVERVRSASPDCDVRVGSADPTGHNLVINGTSLGLQPDDALAFNTDTLTPDMLVADVVIKPQATPLLARAQEVGCRIHGGEPMLTAQLRLMIEFMLA